MPNVEIKAKINDYENVCRRLEELCGPPTIINQEDIFYKVNEGWLKMKFNADSSATLVRYGRADEGGPKLSNYELLDFSAKESDKSKLLHEMLKKCLGIPGRVVKERKVFVIGQIRIHIDTVEDLGHIMELEVMLEGEQSTYDGQTIAWELQSMIGVNHEDLIDNHYADILDYEYN